MTAVKVELPEAVYARLRAEAFRRRSTVPALLAAVAERATAPLPEPAPPGRRPLAVVVRDRVASHLAAGRSVEWIAQHLSMPVERVQRVVEELQP